MNPKIKKAAGVALYVVGFHALLFLMTHCSFTRYTEKSFEAAKKAKPFDAIIVPGVPYQDSLTSGVLKMRVFWAKHLYDSGFAKHIIFSGAAVYSPYVEARAMKIMADSLGIPAHFIFCETKAEHSTENVYYSTKLAQSLGFQKIALATDPFQSVMLRGFMKKYCPEVESVPIVFGKLNIESKRLPYINADSAFVQNFVPITARESFWQRFRGTRGKRVEEEVKRERQAKNKR